MKLGAAYTVFNGIELMEDSIDSIRESVDYGCVVYQDVSNHGRSSEYDLPKFFDYLKSKGKVDDYFYYKTDLSLLNRNELPKNQQCVEAVRNAGCSHFILMDVDEFFIREDFDAAKKVVEEGGYDAAYCEQVVYCYNPWTEWNYDRPLEIKTGKPVLFDIADPKRNMRFNESWPGLQADPFRKMPSKNIKHFDTDELVFHHMSEVRYDVKEFASKHLNQAKRADKEKYTKVANHNKSFENWEDGDDFVHVSGKVFKTRRVEQKFALPNFNEWDGTRWRL